MRKIQLAIFCLPLLLAACGTKKAAMQDNAVTKEIQTLQQGAKTATGTDSHSSFALAQKVNDTKVVADNIVADMTFSATMGSKDVSVPGSLHMRRGKMIRLQLFVPILHTEVGRLEFTPDYVLVVDRLHKQYIKEDYTKLDFLRANGLNFYSLQALFWNQLFLPGETSVSETDLSKFKAALAGAVINVALTRGDIAYSWKANSTSGLISDAAAKYSSAAHGNSSLTWKYANFKSVGAKMFPAYQEFTFNTTATKSAKSVKVVLDMDGIDTSSKWSLDTQLSDKYKKVEATDVFGKLFNM